MIFESALAAHPRTPCPMLSAVHARVALRPAGGLQIEYRLAGDIEALRWPDPAPAVHTEGLWRHTCLEAFIAGKDGPGYTEFNFSPSGAWAAWRFDGRREGMRPEPLRQPPAVALERTAAGLRCEVRLEQVLPCPARLALCAVIEDRQGQLYYWALRHPAGVPDFHDPRGFILQLEDAA